MNTDDDCLRRTEPQAYDRPRRDPLLASRVLIHVGLRKTGTTWLQNHLFGRNDTGFWTPTIHEAPSNAKTATLFQKAITRALYQDDHGRMLPDEDFDPEQLRAHLRPIEVPAGRCAVLSNERLGGYPLSNGSDRAQICQRIKEVFPNARILLVIREQRSMIISNYTQCLKHGDGHSLRQYIDGKWDPSTPTLTPHYFKYHRLIRLYQATFGPENVLTLPFEMIREAPADYVNRICRFSGVDTPPDLPFHEKSNERSRYFPYVFLRRLAPFLRSSRGNAYNPAILGRSQGRAVHHGIANAIGKVTPISLDHRVRERLRAEVEELSGDTYVASNRETERLIGIKLGPLGYRV